MTVEVSHDNKEHDVKTENKGVDNAWSSVPKCSVVKKSFDASFGKKRA